MNLNESQGILHCEAGCILETLQDYAKEYGY